MLYKLSTTECEEELLADALTLADIADRAIDYYLTRHPSEIPAMLTYLNSLTTACSSEEMTARVAERTRQFLGNYDHTNILPKV